MRLPRNFRPEQLYAITQRGNQRRWVYRDAEDFEQALTYMRGVELDDATGIP